ncbi:hypothetical protein ACOMHN_009174 [Nucella lapillus]
MRVNVITLRIRLTGVMAGFDSRKIVQSASQYDAGYLNGEGDSIEAFSWRSLPVHGMLCWAMGVGDSLVVLLLSFLLHLPPPLHCLSVYPVPAEIVSGNKTGQLEFAVGSDVTIGCRVNEPAQYDVTKMLLLDQTTKENFDVIVVGDDTIETTLHNATLRRNNVIVCREGSIPLTRKTLCVGYAPSTEMQISCRLYPEHRLDCEVRTDQPLDTMCNVVWTMHYRKPEWDADTWKPFPGSGPEGRFEVAHNVSWLFGPEDLFYYSNISVRVTAANDIGLARTDLAFKPVDYVVPGPVESLRVHSEVRDPTSLLVTWYHSPGLGSTVCQAMGGLSYRIDLTSALGHERQMMVEADCETNYRGEQNLTVTGLIPYTAYRVTLTPLSPRVSGNNRSAENTTSQSRPLKAPTIVGWSARTSPDRVVVYWKTVSHRYRGGPIIAHSITVDSKKSGREDYHFNVSADVVGADRQVVTSPWALKNCSAECVVIVTSSTVVGASAPASVRISSRPKDLTMPFVYTEKAESGYRTVSLEGSVNVTSVAWCYGTSFDDDNSLIHCQTEVEEKDVETPAVHHLVLPASLLATPHYPPLQCDNCRWHFAVRVPAHTPHHPDTDTADDTGHDTDTVHDTGHDTDTADMHYDNDSDMDYDKGSSVAVSNSNYDASNLTKFRAVSRGLDGRGRLVWNRCRYALDGEAPVPEVQTPEAVSSDGVNVIVQTLCSGSHERAGKPIQAQLAYGLSPQNCSDLETRNISLGVYENGTMHGQLSLSGLRRGSDYTLCVRLRSWRGWGRWRLKGFSMKTWADDMRHVIAALTCVVTLVVLVLLGYSVYRFRRNLKEKSRRFAKSGDFTLKDGPVHNSNNSSLQTLYIPTNEIPMSTKLEICIQRGSLSSKDSAFEENSDGSGDGVKPQYIHPPVHCLHMTSDPTSMSRVEGQEPFRDLGSDLEDEKDRLLGVNVSETAKKQLAASVRAFVGCSLDMSPPKIIRLGKTPLSMYAIQQNVPASSSGTKLADCFKHGQEMSNSLCNCRLCEEAKPQTDAAGFGKDTERSLCFDSQEASPAEGPKEQRSANTRNDLQYVKVDFPSHPFVATSAHACCEDPLLPSHQTRFAEGPGTDAEAAVSSKVSMIPGGTCSFSCSLDDLISTRHISSSPQEDSCLIDYPADLSDFSCSLTDNTDQTDGCCVRLEHEGAGCYIPLRHAVGEITEDSMFSVSEERAPEMPVSLVSRKRPHGEIPRVPADQVNPYIPLADPLTETVS